MAPLLLVPLLLVGGAVTVAATRAHAATVATAARLAALPRYDVGIPPLVSTAVDRATGTPGDGDAARLRAFAKRLAPYPIAQSAVIRFASTKG